MSQECAHDIDPKAAYAKYKLFFDCTLDAAFFVDANGKILDANTVAVSMYGYSLKELHSMNIRNLRTTSERASVEKLLKEAFVQGLVYETVHQRKDESEFPVEISSRGLIMDHTRFMISIVRDITSRKEQERSLARLAAIVESSDLSRAT